MARNPFQRVVAPLLVLFALACGLIGCRPAHPLNQKISANSSIDHNLWRANVQGSLSREQWADFDEAIQEVRLKIMAEHVATLSADVEQALWERIHKRPLCEVMTEGFKFRLARLTEELAEKEKVLAINNSLRTKPGDTESADYLYNLREEATDELESLDAKIAKVQEQLRAYDPVVFGKSS